jgi:hypothetical protein
VMAKRTVGGISGVMGVEEINNWSGPEYVWVIRSVGRNVGGFYWLSSVCVVIRHSGGMCSGKLKVLVTRSNKAGYCNYLLIGRRCGKFWKEF